VQRHQNIVRAIYLAVESHSQPDAEGAEKIMRHLEIMRARWSIALSDGSCEVTSESCARSGSTFKSVSQSSVCVKLKVSLVSRVDRRDSKLGLE
jgi:hypothetical protein